MSIPVEIISEQSHLNKAVTEMANFRAIGLDTESNSRHRYPSQLCLIQISTPHKLYVIDTIVLKEITALKEVLDASIIKVVQGADYDIRSLDRHYGFRIRNLYDTSVAARFAGLTRVGLTTLIEDLLGVTITKSNKLQRADWGRRPLSDEAIEYAATDVRYLLAIREVLEKRLHTLGRTEWVAEECSRLEEVRYSAPNPETAYFSIKGSRDLDGRGLAILQYLFQFREKEALRQNRPPFFIIPDTTLIALATNPESDLSEVPGIGRTGLRRFGLDLRKALQDGLTAPPISLPHPIKSEPVSREQQVQRLGRIKALKAWRASFGTRLSMSPSLIWPMSSLKRIAKAPDIFISELASIDIRRWQLNNFSSDLSAFLESLPR